MSLFNAETTQVRKNRLRCDFDSPVIYGDRVETSNPYHLGYIERLFNLRFQSNSLFVKSQLFFL